jgi:alanine-glyoxylate transaminase/serine-glyoxylate transaminase/serine-pyruvate transaminase
VTAVLVSGHDPQRLRAYCNENCGVVLGHGIGDLTGQAFRIAHMGHVNAPMILGTLSVVEVALGALGRWASRMAEAARRPPSIG